MTLGQSEVDRMTRVSLECGAVDEQGACSDPKPDAKPSTKAARARPAWRNRSALRAGRRAFWIWIAYQSIKGTLTLLLIWIPLFLLWIGG